MTTVRCRKRRRELAIAVGRNVRAQRELVGLTQVELAERALVKRPNLTRLEAGKHLPDLEVLDRVARALELRLGDLVP